MAYVTVYSPDGKKFEVASRDRADTLILQKGWTQTPPVVEDAVEPEPERKSRKAKKEEKVSDPEEGADFHGWPDSEKDTK